MYVVLSAQSILPAAVVAPIINHTTHGLIVYTNNNTHNNQFEDLTLHECFLLTFTTCYPVQDTCICKCPKQCTLTDQIQHIRPIDNASILAIWQTLFVCLTGSYTTQMLDQTCFLGGLSTMGVQHLYSNSFELLSHSEDKTRYVCYTHVIIITHKFSAVLDSLDTSKKQRLYSPFPFPYTCKSKKLNYPNARGYSHHHHQIGLIRLDHSVLVKA